MRNQNRLSAAVFATLLAAAALAQTPPVPSPPAQPPKEAPPPVESATVSLEGEPLFEVKGSLGPFTAQERAAAASKLIKRMADDPFFDPDIVTIEEGEDSSTLLYRDQVLGKLTDEDAAHFGRPRQEVAAERVHVVQNAIREYRERRRPEFRTRAITTSIVGGGLLVLLFLGLRWLHRRLMAWVEARQAEGRALRFQNRQVVDPERFALYRKRAIKLVEWGMGLLMALIYLEVVFSVFPLTRAFGISFLRYALDPVESLWSGFLQQIDNLFYIAVIVVLTKYLLKVLKWLHTEAAAGEIHLPGIHAEWALSVYKLVRLAVLALAAVIIYPYVPGSDSAAFKGISLFLGVVVSLGSSGAAGQFIGGLVVMSMKPFRIGDRVEVGGVTGDVVAISMAFTRVRTIKNEEVTVPNAQVLSGKLVNYSALARNDGLILHTSVTIGYDAPWRTVHELLIRAALRTEGILSEPAPFVLQTALNDFYVTYEINAYTRAANEMATLYAKLHQNIQDSFNEAGVEIMSAHYTYLRDGNAVTIPEKYRPEGYRPPSFLIRAEKQDKEGG